MRPCKPFHPHLCHNTASIGLLMVMLASTSISIAGQEVTIINCGLSAYQIYHAPDAPSSVIEAAKELQHYLHKATGASLRVVSERQVPQEPIIALGDNAAAAEAGLHSRDVPLEGYRITARGKNIFILGPDTPDGEQTTGGGFSTGTRNGVYTFLEDSVGVRWLMPGEVGEDVPLVQTLTIPSTDRIDQPGFVHRELPYVQNEDPLVQQWLKRHKIGYSQALAHEHEWHKAIPAELFDEHPDWFAMIQGERIRPAGDRYKLETTNPQLIRFYADQIIAAFNADPDLKAYSISPSDSGNWSESPESNALNELDPTGRRSVTPLVLKFYNDVAKLVGQVHPDRKLCGYIYSNYFYPPTGGIPTIEPNLVLVTAPDIDYGYQLYRADRRDVWQQVIGAWAEATSSLFYFDLPTTNRPVANPPAPGLDILAFIYPRLAEYNYLGVYTLGADAWGNGANLNYLLAKLAWNPHADVHATAEQFYHRAYGPDAGPLIAELYHELDQWMADFYRANHNASYPLTDDLLREVYADHYDRIESLYLEAASMEMTKVRRERLELLGQNLVLLNWFLRWQKMMPSDQSSPLYRTRDEISKMLSDPNNQLMLAMAAEVQTYEPPRWVGVSAQAWPDGSIVNAEPVDSLLVRGGSSWLVMLEQDGPTTILCHDHRRNAGMQQYLNPWALRDAKGNVIGRGFLARGEPIRFEAQANQTYRLDIDATSAIYGLDFASLPYLVGAQPTDKGLHVSGMSTPLYFHVPQSVGRFSVILRSGAPAETAMMEVIDPTGRLIHTLATVEQVIDEQTIDARNTPPGFWKLRFREAPTGYFDDTFIRIDDALNQWLLVNPENPLALTAPE